MIILSRLHYHTSILQDSLTVFSMYLFRLFEDVTVMRVTESFSREMISKRLSFIAACHSFGILLYIPRARTIMIPHSPRSRIFKALFSMPELNSLTTDISARLLNFSALSNVVCTESTGKLSIAENPIFACLTGLYFQCTSIISKIKSL